MEYRKNGLLHREDGPAICRVNGHKEWVINGKNHRLDGPAVIWSDGSQTWFIEGKKINSSSQEDFEKSEDYIIYIRKEKLKAFW